MDIKNKIKQKINNEKIKKYFFNFLLKTNISTNKISRIYKSFKNSLGTYKDESMEIRTNEKIRKIFVIFI